MHIDVNAKLAEKALGALSICVNEHHATEQIKDGSRGTKLYVVKLDGEIPFVLLGIGEEISAKQDIHDALAEFPSIGIASTVQMDRGSPKLFRRRFSTGQIEQITGYAPPPADLFVGRRLVAMKDGLAEKFESVLYEAHCRIRDIDGLHDDEALEELCKVILLKVVSETASCGCCFGRRDQDTPDEHASRLRWHYAAVQKTSHAVSPGASEEETFPHIRLSNAALSAVAEEFSPYEFSSAPLDVKGRAFQKVLAPAMRAGMGQYFTPLEVVNFIIDCIDPKAFESVVDPFCGSGHFLTGAMGRVCALGGLAAPAVGIEKSDRMVRIAFTDIVLAGNLSPKLYHSDSLLDFRNYQDLRPNSFDVAMTNPPFGSLLRAETVGQLGHFDNAPSKGAVGLEILGLERSLQFLKPGGRLGIVLPESILSNRRNGPIRNWLLKVAAIRGIISLPVETFTPFGANIKTCILFLRKLHNGEKSSASGSIFLGKADSIGYDASGRLGLANELPDLAQQFKTFLSKEGW